MQGSVFIEKNIPICAGLGGGSADCAATLALLNQYHKTEIDEQTLLAWAAELGSDVPFCLTGGTALAKGRGEILQKLPELPDCYIIICKPSGGISTRDAFAKIGNVRKRVHPDTQGALGAIESGDLTTLSQYLYNAFEDGAAQSVREIAEIRGELLDSGALGAVMSGSGSAMIGIFDKKNKALEAETTLKPRFASTYLTRPTREGFRVVPEKSASEGAAD